jgi:hypothetical protein
MKRLFKALLSTVLTFLTFSCSETGNSESNSKEQMQVYLVKAGQDHNKGLDFIFDQLSGETTTAKNFSQLINSIEGKTNMFLEKSSESVQYQNINLAKKYASVSIKDVRLGRTRNARVKESDELWNFSDANKLTSKQKELLSTLNDAMTNDSLGLQETLNAFEIIRTKAKLECSDKEAFVVLAAVEVGVNSLAYWHQNIDKWKALAAKIEGRNASGKTGSIFSWKSVAKSDVSGAVGAAVGVGVISVVSGPPGWAAGGGAVLGGAVGASATNAVDQLLASWLGYVVKSDTTSEAR